MNTHNHNEIFIKLRNKNIQEEKILATLMELKKSESITSIEKHGCNLLFLSCMYDNDIAFKVLADNFSQEFKNEFKRCVILTYPNKNPNILKLALQHINIQTDSEKEELLKKFANNCFRNENIDITQNWLQQNLHNKQIELFISELFRNNNKPYLTQISKIDFWREQIKKISFTLPEEKLFFYKNLIAEPILNKTVSVSTETIGAPEITSIKKSKELIVLKKKKKSNNLLPA